MKNNNDKNSEEEKSSGALPITDDIILIVREFGHALEEAGTATAETFIDRIDKSPHIRSDIKNSKLLSDFLEHHNTHMNRILNIVDRVMLSVMVFAESSKMVLEAKSSDDRSMRGMENTLDKVMAETEDLDNEIKARREVGSEGRDIQKAKSNHQLTRQQRRANERMQNKQSKKSRQPRQSKQCKQCNVKSKPK